MTTVIAAVAVIGATKYVINQYGVPQADPLARLAAAIPKSHPGTELVRQRQKMILMTAATKNFKVVGRPKVASVPVTTSSGPTSTASAPTVFAPPPNPGTAQAIAYKMLPSFGFSAKAQYGCLNNIWTRESGWRYNAANASGAYGIPQALPGSKMQSAGSDWQTNPATQIRWGLGYIKGRYGSPCNAWGFWQGHGWY